MHGRRKRSAPAQRRHLVAGQRAAAVQSNSSLPVRFLRQRALDFRNRVIRHAKPNHVGIDCRPRNIHGPRAHSLRQRSGPSPGRAAVSEHDLVDDVAGPMQTHRQSRAQIPRSNNGDPRTTMHAGQNSRGQGSGIRGQTSGLRLFLSDRPFLFLPDPRPLAPGPCFSFWPLAPALYCLHAEKLSTST
jgi:hypothetical protein